MTLFDIYQQIKTSPLVLEPRAIQTPQHVDNLWKLANTAESKARHEWARYRDAEILFRLQMGSAEELQGPRGEAQVTILTCRLDRAHAQAANASEKAAELRARAATAQHDLSCQASKARFYSHVETEDVAA